MKYTIEYLKKICDEKDLKLVGVDTKFANGKNRRCACVMCNHHQDRGVQWIPVEKLDKTKRPCCYCNHSKLKDIFADEVHKVNPTIEILSEYVNWNTPVKCKCVTCGNEWEGRAAVLLYGGGCKICGYKKIWDSRGRKTTDDFIEEMNLVNSQISIIGEYNGSHKLIRCQCNIDGCEWESYAANLLNGTAGCPECTNRIASESQALSMEDFAERLNSTNPHISLVGKYKNAREKTIFYCSKHDLNFTSTPANFLYKNGKGCPKCSQSTGEYKMMSILSNHGYSIVPQYTFNDCKYINKLKFDGYDEEHQIAYEYQGEQHYIPIDFAGKGEKWANDNLRLIQKRDNIKRSYCQENNITLIEIPYWEFDDMENYILNNIKIA